jgi:hypothetical protein
LRDPDLDRPFEDDDDEELLIDDGGGGLSGVRDVEATFREDSLFGSESEQDDDAREFGI